MDKFKGKLFKLEKGKITKDGHTMFDEDIVRELNGWRNYAKSLKYQLSLKQKTTQTEEGE